MIPNLKAETDLFWKTAWRYRSNWRVLHIDGFETGHTLPLHMGINRQFFQYVPPSCRTIVIDVPKERTVSKPRVLEAPYNFVPEWNECVVRNEPWPEQRARMKRAISI